MSPDPSSHSPAARAEAQAMALGFAHGGERRAFERFREELTPQGWVIAHNLYSADLPPTNRDANRNTNTTLLLIALAALTGLAGVQIRRRA